MKRPHDCYYLANKAFFFPPQPAPTAAEQRARPLSTPCWCLRTHTPVGPDGGETHPASCDARRDCYQPEVDLEA